MAERKTDEMNAHNIHDTRMHTFNFERNNNNSNSKEQYVTAHNSIWCTHIAPITTIEQELNFFYHLM